jgi:hypothetical protein
MRDQKTWSKHILSMCVCGVCAIFYAYVCVETESENKKCSFLL